MASDTWGSVSVTRLWKTVRERRMVTPARDKDGKGISEAQRFSETTKAVVTGLLSVSSAGSKLVCWETVWMIAGRRKDTLREWGRQDWTAFITWRPLRPQSPLGVAIRLTAIGANEYV
ncbi:hypothetical protein E2C01_023748 [Portunus trituberculatus]|uniref:Uncharacterized protein n=1 Tax=Portunus trituberculatus TaxID=210409 RepID=A0A5B7E910_PORTR|nr:hypothetical protein [Portunus trituberculatus]